MLELQKPRAGGTPTIGQDRLPGRGQSTAEYTVVTKGKRWRDMGFTLRATILTANVLNVLTGETFQIVVDDDF